MFKRDTLWDETRIFFFRCRRVRIHTSAESSLWVETFSYESPTSTKSEVDLGITLPRRFFFECRGRLHTPGLPFLSLSSRAKHREGDRSVSRTRLKVQEWHFFFDGRPHSLPSLTLSERPAPSNVGTPYKTDLLTPTTPYSVPETNLSSSQCRCLPESCLFDKNLVFYLSRSPSSRRVSFLGKVRGGAVSRVPWPPRPWPLLSPRTEP